MWADGRVGGDQPGMRGEFGTVLVSEKQCLVFSELEFVSVILVISGLSRSRECEIPLKVILR